MGVDYAPFYCEENVLRLAAARDRSTDWVVLLSNATRRIALAGQRRGRDGDGIVVWDYHVILVDRRGEGDASSTKVIDQDSLLDQPVPVCRYVATTFPWPLYHTHPEYAPRFSLVTAPDYRRRFSSDRSHMRRPDGTWHSPPPHWPPTYDTTVGNTLFALCDGSDTGVTASTDLLGFTTWAGCETWRASDGHRGSRYGQSSRAEMEQTD